MPTYKHPPLVRTASDRVLLAILGEIQVELRVLDEAKTRRNLITTIARQHPAGRAIWNSGSIAHGTENDPLGDADCGVMLDRIDTEFRTYGPDAPEQLAPAPLIGSFAEYIEPRVRRYYPDVVVDLTGNRAIKFDMHKQVEIDELGIVDPSIDLILGLARVGANGIWIPNRSIGGWDAAWPQRHTELMVKVGEPAFRTHRAHLIRLAKRAVKRDEVSPGSVRVVCSWNLSALAIYEVTERLTLTAGLIVYLRAAGTSISSQLTPDPAQVADPIALPDGVTQPMAASRLHEMAAIVESAAGARTNAEAEQLLKPLFGVEIDRIARRRERENASLANALRRGDSRGIAAAVAAPVAAGRMRSDGAR